jgi:hypothetical protein
MAAVAKRDGFQAERSPLMWADLLEDLGFDLAARQVREGLVQGERGFSDGSGSGSGYGYGDGYGYGYGDEE